MRLIDADNELYELRKMNVGGEVFGTAVDFAIKVLEEAPTVEPERKKGKWIPLKGGGYSCSKCKGYPLDRVDSNFMRLAVKSDFCPWCGADMRGEQNGNQ